MKLEDFESVFRSAVKTPFHHKPPSIQSVLLVTDMERPATLALSESAQAFLGEGCRGAEWTTMSAGDFSEVGVVLDRVRRNPPDLVVCYRHLLGQGAKLPYSLGSIVDTLTQATDVPVLLLPRPDSDGQVQLPKTTAEVMVVTDHLTGDDRLVNWAAQLCSDTGTLFLTHIEDAEVLAKYLDICAKIPGLDFDLAKEKIPQKLLSLPRDFISSTAQVLSAANIHEEVVAIVKLGDPVKEYQALIREHDIDLLVMNTKDANQTAMHSLAYALSVEIRDRPLLLL